MSPGHSSALHERLQEFIRYHELRQLAYRFSVLQQEKPFHSLAVLSVFPGEGKTLFCAALALAYAEACRAQVLIVDTTTLQNEGSLELKECFNGSAPQIHVRSLEELRRSPGAIPGPERGFSTDKETVLEGEILRAPIRQEPLHAEDDFSLIERAASDPARHYGLVLLDASPLNTRNKRNVDPFLIARHSDASVLIASRKFLDASNIRELLKLLSDPSLGLLGVIANERMDV